MIRLNLAALVCASTLLAARHRLPVTPETVIIGYYDATTPAALTIESGDTVEISTLGVAAPQQLEAAGVPPEQVQPELRAIMAAHRGVARGHFLTGPVAVTGAEPGDMLEVRILSVRMDVPYAYNAMGAAGVLADQFSLGRRRLIPLDREKGTARFAPGVEVPLRPFFGSMGVAPPAGAGRLSSRAPGAHAGNMDNRELVAGTKLFLPVHAAGALFQVGDGHAAQGDGEVDVTGLETSLTGVFEFILHKRRPMAGPRAETPTHYIAMGFDEDLDRAARIATEEAVAFLAAEKGLSREDAYMLASVAVHLRVTQLVDGNKGVHAMIPKSLFVPR